MRAKLNKLDVLALVIGSIIGWGSFTLPGNEFLPNSGLINTIIGLFIGGFSILFIEKGYKYMMIKGKKEDGGEFSYTYQHLGKKHGFIVGWSLSLCYLSLVPLNATAFVLVLKIVFKELVSWVYLYSIAGYQIYLSDILLAWFIIIIFAIINIKGIHISSFVQNILILLLIINVISIFFTMLFKVDLHAFNLNYISSYRFDLKQIALVLAIVPFLFVGFDVIVQMSTDLGFDRKKSSIVAIIGILIGAAIYSLLNFITALSYSVNELDGKTWALGEGVLENMGVLGFALLCIALLAAVTGGINGFMLSSSKLLGSLATYKLIPSKYAHQNKKYVYDKSIIFISIVSMIAPFFGREVIIYIVDLCSVLAALTYAYVCFISIRYTESLLSKILVCIGFIIAISFIVLLLFPTSPTFLSIPSLLFMVAWGALGLAYYIFIGKKS